MNSLITLCVIALALIVAKWAPQIENFFKPRRRKRPYPDEVYELESRLLNMLQGDVDALKRLLSVSRSVHPGRTAKWHIEKVIWDLERDRR
ncbi:hypothetical protein CAL7716_023910 [Calothrix sp. PCC 7716]|nr:hypothetical protein CAL7716_023910 [Calothrix sp. PCC 7716]